MLTISNNHGGNLAHGTLDHVMVIIHHGVAHSKSRTKNKKNQNKPLFNMKPLSKKGIHVGWGAIPEPPSSFMGSIPHVIY